jgi:hypothetical protein
MRKVCVRVGSGQHRQQAGRVDCPHEEHRQEEQPTARKTLENRRSSTLPSCSRTTPMNHRKAIPANGTRWRLKPDQASSLRICLECLKATFRPRNTDHRQASQEQHGQTRSPQSRPAGGSAAGGQSGQAHWYSHRLNLRFSMTACWPPSTPVGYGLLVQRRSLPPRDGGRK